MMDAIMRRFGVNIGLGAYFGQALLPAGMLAIVLLMVVPVPAVLLDIFFITNIMMSLVMLMLVLQARRPLDFSIFPTVLLVATLFRLALNVASTRVVLVAGHEGHDAAGKVIQAFGEVLIGGNFVVGLIVFVILMIVNIAVIAKGAGRVSEVSARFTLDALPGKQMAIDADLNAGMLTPDEARARRAEVAAEADFYGSMDGASKFVKGDAMAGILILLVNIIGGLIIGMVSHGLSLSEAADLYIQLSVGDALVAQIPALLLSIAAAILVTRNAQDKGLSGELTSQFSSPAAWWPAAGVLGIMGLIPALPSTILLPAAAFAGAMAWKLGKKAKQTAPETPAAAAAASTAIDWQDVTETAPILMEIGYGLVPLVDGEGALMSRVTGIRRQLSQELGFVVPLARVRDNLGLPPHAYRVTIAGEHAGQGEAWPSDLLALEAEAITRDIPGRVVRDPAFGMKARWIDPAYEDDAISAGYTVVNCATVIGTHLYKALKDRGHIVFGQDDMQGLIDTLGQQQPQLSAAISSKSIPLSTTTAICQRLLEEGVSLRAFPRIAAAIAHHAGLAADVPQMTEAVRSRISGLIVAGLGQPDQALLLVALAPRLESLIVAAHRAAPQSEHPFEPGLGLRVAEAVAAAAQTPLAAGGSVALVCQPGPRRALWRLLKGRPGLPVLSFAELQDSPHVEIIAVVGEDLLESPATTEEPTWTPAHP